jgi:hypothetical protein
MSAPIQVTFFDNQWARKLRTQTLTLERPREIVLRANAASKDGLPWLKLAQFGDWATENGSLRHDGNVKAITGIELDYDAEKLSLKAGAKILEQAGLWALLYTSPSHTKVKPHWRVLLPTSQPRPPRRPPEAGVGRRRVVRRQGNGAREPHPVAVVLLRLEQGQSRTRSSRRHRRWWLCRRRAGRGIAAPRPV